jgi:hypothetical protein
MRISRLTIAAIVLTTGALGVAAAQQKPAATQTAAPTLVTVYKTPT